VEEDLPWQSEVAWAPTPSGPVQTSTLDAAHGPDDDLRAAIERVLATGRFERLEGLNVAFPPPPPGDTPPPGPPGRLRAAVVLPLLARGRTHGALTLALGPSGRCYSAADLALAQDLANRAAVALDNARLYEALRESDRRKDEFLAMLAHELRN